MIDLGQKMNDGPCCAPMSDDGGKDKKHYPTLYFTHGEKIEFPESGEAVIKFRKIESAENTRDPDDPKYRCELEVQGIEVKEGKSSDKAPDFKKGLRKKLGKMKPGDEGESEDEEY